MRHGVVPSRFGSGRSYFLSCYYDAGSVRFSWILLMRLGTTLAHLDRYWTGVEVRRVWRG
jgi:hypothetical protein